MDTKVSEELKGRYLNEAVSGIVSVLNESDRPVYSKQGSVYDLVYISDTPDGIGDISLPRVAMHIRETTGTRPILFGLFKKNLEQSLFMFEHGGEDLWKVHALAEFSPVIDNVINPAMDEFSRKTGDRYEVIFEESIPYRK